MDNSRPDTRITAPGKPGADIIARLEALRDRHRLGIHMWENYGETDCGYPKFSREILNATAAPEIPSKITVENTPLTSLSLLPTAISGLSMCPYEAYANGLDACGYLLNLDELQEYPPCILMASPTNLNSNVDLANNDIKKTWNMVSRNSMLNELYGLFQNNITNMRAALSGSEGTKISAMQLDILGTHTRKDASANFMRELLPDREHIIPHNELIGVVSSAHIAAIVAPDYFDVPYPEWYPPMQKLMAATCGLEHLAHGEKLPVVSYHINGQHSGQFSYVGEGKRELTQAALDALQEIASNPLLHEKLKFHIQYESLQKDYFDHFSDIVERHLDVNIFATNVDLKRDLASAQAALSQGPSAKRG